MKTSELTAVEKNLLDKLRMLPDSQIDTTDIPEASESHFAAARRPNLFKPLKKAVTIRLDADVLDWFQAQAGGRGYQTAINRALRTVMQAERLTGRT
jgi:uncharacterized protein (DUF4415 family)